MEACARESKTRERPPSGSLQTNDTRSSGRTLCCDRSSRFYSNSIMILRSLGHWQPFSSQGNQGRHRKPWDSCRQRRCRRVLSKKCPLCSLASSNGTALHMGLTNTPTNGSWGVICAGRSRSTGLTEQAQSFPFHFRRLQSRHADGTTGGIQRGPNSFTRSLFVSRLCLLMRRNWGRNYRALWLAV